MDDSKPDGGTTTPVFATDGINTMVVNLKVK